MPENTEGRSKYPQISFCAELTTSNSTHNCRFLICSSDGIQLHCCCKVRISWDIIQIQRPISCTPSAPRYPMPGTSWAEPLYPCYAAHRTGQFRHDPRASSASPIDECSRGCRSSGLAAGRLLESEVRVSLNIRDLSFDYKWSLEASNTLMRPAIPWWGQHGPAVDIQC